MVENYSDSLSKEDLKNALKLMLVSREIDNKAMNLLRQGKTFFHIAAAGHEAIQTAVGMNLNPQKDWLFPYYRDLTLVLTAGVTPKDFFLQCFAKANDPSSGGRQLPCHYGAPLIKLPSQSSNTGTQFLQAVGTALASVKEGIDSITYVSSGEGTTSQGEFHEAINWASREKLPVLFVIENNRYAISVPISQQTGGVGGSIAEMMAGYESLLRMKIDGTDFEESHNSVKKALDYLKSKKGPVLIEAEVVRLQSHSSSDDQKKYREHEELEKDLMNCPINKLSHKMIAERILTQAEIDNMRKTVHDEVENAADEAFKAADPNIHEAEKYIFDESGFKEKLVYEKNIPAGPNIVMVDAINHALHEEMARNDKMFIFGEDIADGKGGVFTATKGLSTKFGDERVFNSPLAEASIVGVAVGMSLAGMKTVVEIQFGDYIWPAFMQIKNELATFRYRSNNTWSSPVVIRVAIGGYIHGGLYHSQNIESVFAHIHGIYIAFPSNAADAKGLLKTACRINDPVLFLEHKGLYRQSYATAPEPDDEYLVPFGKAKVVREGNDVTVISYGVCMWDSILAAKKLQDEGFSVEVIDLRTIIPLDTATIYNSVRKTNKAVIIHEDTLTGGFGGEIASRISEFCFEHLDGPVKRIAAKDSHIPYSPALEDAILPNRTRIYRGIKELLEY
ncbi:MAG: tungsten formylmethanofuran dehydrogenase [Ignavibacteria bacterium RIFOXYB2_FULL_35_12]|nr:MAG: tungsten formylmethanofuran dehydrogenase [Ignavibacteria bacterium GWA2_36_19]OGU57896.1 MAG: tungsten formylmethanofuran dehydrogenase [Ignavibacteria bacterium GWF2_35_20]OGU83136.1 MAG: tungsten formylmethanofuran dehydrogenase [Ignavibacteria bacterium RIFOXYA2_FULL_35_9]OGU87217.1 MAG: tungsten formylmethanofuran dehydrogenase [Ignavibacteria bacterium RIFOXYC12_FULL_35_11]OGU89537.1 MAG: tungsten formylmethanofuran dehydrogenase [Ignavibacteria bacterium RIFOXYA12_FULL_35_25]OGU